MTIFSAHLPYAKATLPKSEILEYRLVQLQNIQRRLQDRDALEPVIDLASFECRSVIDRIVIRLHSGRPTQFRYVQAAVEEIPEQRTPHLDRIDGTDASATVYDVTLQEPTVKSLLEVVEHLEKTFACVAPTELRLLEVSVDFRPKAHSDVDRARMLGVLQRAILPTRDIWSEWRAHPRFVFGDKPNEKHRLFATDSEKRLHPEIHLSPLRGTVPAVDATFYLGAENSDVLIRVMDKVIDRQNLDAGTWVDLPDDQKRVRIEVVLAGRELIGLDLCEPRGLIGFRFNRLQGKIFRFMLPTFQRATKASAARSRFDAVLQEFFLRTGVVGLSHVKTSRNASLAKHVPMLKKHLKALNRTRVRNRTAKGQQEDLVAYAELNAMVQTSLTLLARREARALAAV